ncbi:MAG TPA: class I SAM-dependent methyltransferase [Chlamydiales bacterium]|nr:class I SAM-dependent methyltransferase [Chlamydiales bacterium]
MKKWLIFFCFSLSLYANPVDDLKAKVSQGLPNLYGWCTKEKALSFIDLVLEVKPDVCVEIGVFGGRSLLPVAATLQFLGRGVVIGVDPWSKEEAIRHFDPVKDQPHINWWAQVNYDEIYNSYLNMLTQYQLEDYVITLRTTSALASYAIGPIDILYLDGNHNERVSNRDVKLYLPKVRPGGYIWLNDSLLDNLQSSLNLLFETCDCLNVIDGGNTILFRKR